MRTIAIMQGGLVIKASSFRPSNGTQGMMFEDVICSKCIHYHDGGCNIILMAMGYDLDDPEYPTEWVQINPKHRVPWICTAFEKRTKNPKPPTEPPAQFKLFHVEQDKEK